MVVVMDDWMRAAMADDRVVVELLVRLKKAHAVAPVKVPMLPPTKWGVRQPRSRFPIRFDARTLQKDATDSTRNSPTTPLSWTASAASPSCTADGLDESSVRCVVTARSKGVGNLSNDFTNNSGTKRSRRKKTYAELIEEETFLLKQKMYLKKEIEKMQATYKEQRERNQILKKMKVDLNTNNDMNESKLSSSSSDSQTVSDPYQESHHDDPSRNKNNVFLLPDLNMEPFEEDSAGFQVF